MSKHNPFADTAVVVFDAYGTLLDLSGIAERLRPQLGERAAPLADLWRRKQLEYTWLRSLMGRHADFWHVTGEAADHALTAFGLSDPALRTRMMEAWLSPRAFAEVPDMLARLRQRGFKTAILSNGSPTMLTSGVGAAGLGGQLDAVLSVEKVGVFKPHPSVYRLAVDHFDVEPREVCFVSGNGWDVAGAAAFGFRVAWVNRAGATPESLPAGPDATIADLAGLPGLLGAA